MTDTVAILTGASRGLGHALALGLAREGTLLITLARTARPELAEYAHTRGCTLQEHTVDLSGPAAIETAARQVFSALPTGASRYLLINNAGTLGPVGPGPHPAQDIAAALQLNVAAAMVLTGHFLRTTEGLAQTRRVLNISSGAGRGAVAGWGVYCASKAALDMYTQCVKLEQGQDGARIVSLAPGVIDTAMQAEIRATDPADFPSLSRFTGLHANGQLSAPDAVAARILAYLDRDDFGDTEIDDIRQY